MSYNPKRHKQQSLRLPDYDYRTPGAYFVTICAAHRRCLFGTVIDDRMHLNDFGAVVAEEWRRTEQVRDRMMIDTFVVMPISTAGRFTKRSRVNHTHGVIIITDPPDTDDDAPDRSESAPNDDAGNRTFGGAIAGSLSTIMRQFKSMVTKRINRMRDTPNGDVWQRNFYEHVVRNREALQRIRRYIQRNPKEWNDDQIHPDRDDTI